MNTAWISRVDAALREVTELRIRLKDAEDRIEALESLQVSVIEPVNYVDGLLLETIPVKRKPGRPRKNA